MSGTELAPFTPQAVVPAGFDRDLFKAEMDRAGFFASSMAIPKRFWGKPQDCLAVLQLADQIQVPALIVMQEVSVSDRGSLTFSAKFLGALAIRAGLKLAYEITYGDEPIKGFPDIRVRAYNKRDPSEEGFASTQLAIDEEWATRNKKYRTMLLQMLKYRAVTFLVRAHYMDVSFIAPMTTEEAEDLGHLDDAPPDRPKAITAGPTTASGMAALKEAASQGEVKADTDPRKAAAGAAIKAFSDEGERSKYAVFLAAKEQGHAVAALARCGGDKLEAILARARELLPGLAAREAVAGEIATAESAAFDQGAGAAANEARERLGLHVDEDGKLLVDSATYAQLVDYRDALRSLLA